MHGDELFSFKDISSTELKIARSKGLKDESDRIDA